MHGEILAVLVVHWWKAVIAVVVGFFGFKAQQSYVKSEQAKENRFKNLEEKASNTYTKEETRELVDNKIAVPNEKITNMEAMLATLLERDQESQRRSDERDEKILSHLQELKDSMGKDVSNINTNLAVVQNDIQHIKDKEK